MKVTSTLKSISNNIRTGGLLLCLYECAVEVLLISFNVIDLKVHCKNR